MTTHNTRTYNTTVRCILDRWDGVRIWQAALAAGTYIVDAQETFKTPFGYTLVAFPQPEGIYRVAE